MPSANDAVLRSCLVWLAAIMVVVGLYTQSLRKMMVTYVVGMVGIAGLLLPDWDFFNRDFSRWCYPVSPQDLARSASARPSFFFSRFGAYPVRVVLYTTVYGFALYKWWMYISN